MSDLFEKKIKNKYCEICKRFLTAGGQFCMECRRMIVRDRNASKLETARHQKLIREKLSFKNNKTEV